MLLPTFMEFMGEEELEMMASMAPKPSEAELAAPENYQYCIAIPIGTALAQAWNDDVAEICGDMVGQEMEMFGVHLWLAPAQNIQRSPLCGRNFEYYSEEPIVSGRTSAAVTRGVQKHPGAGLPSSILHATIRRPTASCPTLLSVNVPCVRSI